MPSMKLLLTAFLFLCLARSSRAVRFVLDEEECFSQDVQYDGDNVRVSFVVVKTERAWHYEDSEVDLAIEGPSYRHELLKKSHDKIDFVAHKRGIYKFCFKNKSIYHETIDFDIHVGHIPYYEEHAKDDHFQPVMTQIARLEEAIYAVQFEQHWLQAQTDRQAILNENMSKRVIHKAILECTGLVAASLLQVYLLRRLFEKKLGTSLV